MEEARDEMQSMISKQRISQALRSKLPPAAYFTYNRARKQARVYREKERLWVGPFEVIRVGNKTVTIEIGSMVEEFNKTQILLVHDHPDKKLERLLTGISPFSYDTPRVNIIDIIKKNDIPYGSERQTKHFPKNFQVSYTKDY